MDDRKELDEKELGMVSGGTFTTNEYTESFYNSLGISTTYHSFKKDEFSFMGKTISYDDANRIAGKAYVLQFILSRGYRDGDTIKTTDPAFIRALNSQLVLMGFSKWDGKSGESH